MFQLCHNCDLCFTFSLMFTFPFGILPMTSFPLAIRAPITTEYATTLRTSRSDYITFWCHNYSFSLNCCVVNETWCLFNTFPLKRRVFTGSTRTTLTIISKYPKGLRMKHISKPAVFLMLFVQQFLFQSILPNFVFCTSIVICTDTDLARQITEKHKFISFYALWWI